MSDPLPDFMTPAEGRIYFIAAGEFVKIGYTASPEARARRMLTDNPHELVVLHVEPGSVRQERLYHRHFADIRVRGEWFEYKGDLVKFIATGELPDDPVPEIEIIL